jgi:transcriptional repressor NrdR
VPSGDIGELVMDHLRDLDHIAYIRFASAYRDFADIEDVQREVAALAERGVQPGDGQPTLLPEQELQALTKGLRAFPTKKARGRSANGRSKKSDTDRALGGRP